MRIIFVIVILILNTKLFSLENSGEESVGLIVLNDAIVLAPALLSVLIFHEIGHYSMAKISGAHDVKFGLYKSNPEGGFSIGWTEMNDSLPGFGNAMYNFGGVLFSRGYAEFSKMTINSNIFPTAINRYFAMTYLIGRLDYSRYVFQDALINLLDGTGSDMDNLVTEIAGNSTGWRTLTYASLLTVGVLDLVFGWDEIENHWSILTSNNFKKERAENKISFGVFPSKESINITFVLNF